MAYTVKREIGCNFPRCNFPINGQNINFSENSFQPVNLPDGNYVSIDTNNCSSENISVSFSNGSESYTLYTGPLIPEKSGQTNQETPAKSLTCDGCKTGNCYPFGYRNNGEFCNSTTLSFTPQLAPGASCQNSFECGSNVCVNSQCISPSLIQSIINLFTKLFGAKQ